MKVVKENEREIVLDTGKARLSVKHGLVSFVSSLDASWGWKDFFCETTLDDGTTISSAPKGRISARRRSVDKMGPCEKVFVNYEEGAISGELILTLFEDLPVLFLQHNRTNRGPSPVLLKGLADIVVKRGRISSGERGFFISTENIKTYSLFDDITTRNELFLPLPKETVRVGLSEDFPFSAIFIGSRQKRRGLVDGVLTEERLARVREFRSEDGELIKHFRGEFNIRGIDGVRLEPGETLEGEVVYLELIGTVDLHHIYDNYVEALRRVHHFRGPTSTNRYEMVWGSWNEGVYWNACEELVLRNARWVRKNFPSVKWIQIDSGYFGGGLSGSGLGAAGFYGDIDGNVNKEKFPHGMKWLASEIKKVGLRPALWIGLGVSDSSALFQEHPEWFLMDRRGGHLMLKGEEAIQPDPTAEPIMVQKNTVYFDLSVPEVREFLYRGFHKLIKDWGYEGIKLDFWSYVTEAARGVPRFKEKTLIEWRWWLLGMIRSLLPSDGYFQAGCTIPMGNPFIGLYFDNYRYGWDIGDGNWSHIVESAKWLTALIPFSSSDLIILNSDSASVMSGLGELERYSWYNFCLVTRSLVETAGDLARVKDRGIIRELKKVVACPSNGEKVYFGDFNLFKGKVPPSVWYFCGSAENRERNTPASSLRCVGVFNWGERKKAISVSMKNLGLDSRKTYLIENFWTRKRRRVKGKVSFSLRPHESVLFHVYE